jgi:hypothetical protein
MSWRSQILALSLGTILGLAAAAAYAETANKYQVTGPVLEVTDTMIVVQKGQQRWELLRDAATKITGELKVGAKVTIEYRMTATSVEVKPATTAKKKTK